MELIPAHAYRHAKGRRPAARRSAKLIVEYRRRLTALHTRVSEVERELSESRLRMLHTQLAPHFLFNALNTVSAQVARDPQTTRQLIAHLGELLQCSLENLHEREIELGRELAFLGRYVEFQKVRFEDRFDVVLNVEKQVSAALVPPAILQPLVENAFRHGVLARRRKGLIRVEASRDRTRLHLAVRDDGPGLPRGWDVTSRCGGVGLLNTRERLRQLYGETNQSCAIFNQPRGGVCVELTLPFRTPRASFEVRGWRFEVPSPASDVA
jgi:two-component system LytT family sensor kinase